MVFGIHLDRTRQGTQYSDAMHRILGVCHKCGILWHEEKISYRNGATEMQRVEDVTPVTTVKLTSRYAKYGLHVNPRILPRLLAMGPQFAYALNTPSVSVEVDGDVVYVRVPRQDADAAGTISFEQAWGIAPDIARGSLLLGVDEEGQQLTLPLTDPTHVHCAVIGMTGSGKSTLMKTMALSAQLIGGAQVALFDLMGGLYPLSGHPSVWRSGLFRKAADCAWGLEVLARMAGGEAQRNGLIYVFVDEVPELVRRAPQVKEYLGAIAQAGRHGGLHLILGAQHPLTSELGPATLRNVPVRIVGKVADRAAAYNATGLADSGCERLRGGGDFLGFAAGNKRHFQAALPTDELLAQWLQRYPPRPPRVAVPVGQPARSGQVMSKSPDAGGNGHGSGGRGPDAIPEGVLAAIREEQARSGHVSHRWVRRLTQQPQFGGEEYRNDKAAKAIALALGTVQPQGAGR